MLSSVNFQGINLTSFTLTDLNKYLNKIVTENKTIVAYGFSFGLFPKFRSDNKLFNIVNSFDISVSDGRIFYLIAKLFRTPLKSDLSIPNMVYHSLILANDNKYSVFFLGGSIENNINAQKNVTLMYNKIPKVSGYNGFWTNENEDDIIQKISNEKPNIVFIGLPTPQKEYLAAKLKSMGISNIIIPCGGMIDVLGGKYKVTPYFLKKIGLAWFYRFIQDPSNRIKITIQSIGSFINVLYLIIIRALLLRRKNVLAAYYSDT